MKSNLQVAAFLAVLREAFPSGADRARLDFYAGQIQRTNPDPRDLAEGIQRIIATRESRGFPSIAEILRQTREALALRLKTSEDELLKSDNLRRMTPRDLEEMRTLRALAELGVHHCRHRGAWSVHSDPPQRAEWADDYGMSDCAPDVLGICYASAPLDESREVLRWAIAHRNELPPLPANAFGNLGDSMRLLGVA